MGKNSRRPIPAQSRSSTTRQNAKQHNSVKQAAKKRHHKWSKDRSERVRDDLNRDADILYNVLENPSIVPSSIPQTDFVISLAESMQGLGR